MGARLSRRRAGMSGWSRTCRAPNASTPTARSASPPSAPISPTGTPSSTEFGLKDRATLLFDGQSPGTARTAPLRARRRIPLQHLRPLPAARCFRAPCAKRVYVDLDPAFTQIWAEVYKSDMHLDGHDTFVSIGRHLGQKDCRAPLAGRNWLPIGVPVVLDYFTNPNVGPAGRRLDHVHPLVRLSRRSNTTACGTATNRRNSPSSSISRARRSEKLEIATDLHPDDEATHAIPRKRLEPDRCAARSTRPWQRYRDYIAQSRGEFCVAKNGYVRSRCGWFSDRSVDLPRARAARSFCRKPAGPISIRTAKDCSPFTMRKAPCAALETVAKDPVKHARAARANRGKILLRARRREPVSRNHRTRRSQDSTGFPL